MNNNTFNSNKTITLDKAFPTSETKENLNTSFKEYEPQFMKLIGIFKRYRIEINEDLCKELSQLTLSMFNIGFKAGVVEGISQFEKKLSERFGVNNF